MSIRPVDLSGMLQRTGDVHVVKHQEDVKPLVDQANITQTIEHKESELVHTVVAHEESGQAKNDADAKDEGRGVYGGRAKKGTVKKKADGKIISKASSGGFDIKI